jgi:predicted metal-dependent enzyme (double-stranded beta helix superfamily)
MAGDPEPEYFLDNERVRSIVDTVKSRAETHESVPDLVASLEDPFEALLHDDDWLPERYRTLPPDDYDDKGEMGDEIAQWLLYREGSKLALFTLVLPPGAGTPVHDHLAWGLVGLHGGTQREEFYRRTGDGGDEGHAELERLRTEEMGRGDYYRLLPPDNDIHSVTTTSDEPSVSVHLLGADVGCIERHAFDPEEQAVDLFMSGYTNVECEVEAEGVGHSGGHAHAGEHDHDLGDRASD